MSDDQDGCEWVSVSSGTSHLGSPAPTAVKRLCVCVFMRGKSDAASGYQLTVDS